MPVCAKSAVLPHAPAAASYLRYVFCGISAAGCVPVFCMRAHLFFLAHRMVFLERRATFLRIRLFFRLRLHPLRRLTVHAFDVFALCASFFCLRHFAVTFSVRGVVLRIKTDARTLVRCRRRRGGALAVK